jgi:WD40 repeat protein
MTGKLRSIPNGDKEKVRSVAFSPDGKALTSGRSDGTIRFWDVREGHEKGTFNGDGDFACSIALSRDGTFLALGRYNGTISL